MTRQIFGSAVAIAGLVGVMACSQGSKATSSSLTAPTPESAALVGNDSPGGKLVFSFNLIGTPGDYEGGCGDGRRIFVQRDAHSEHIQITDGNVWRVLECDATFGDTALLQSADVGTFVVYARILGKMGGHLGVCADFVNDQDGILCSLDTIDLTRGQKSKFQLQPSTLFDADFEDILWTVDTNKDFRIVQFRVYQTS